MVQVASASHCVWNRRLGVSAKYETSPGRKFLFRGESVVPSGSGLARGLSDLDHEHVHVFNMATRLRICALVSLGA